MSNYVITGANSEIGRALSKRLVDNGHHLMLVSRSPKKGELTEKCVWIDGIDLTNEGDLIRLGIEINKEFDAPFSLIHSVGDFWKHKDILTTEFDEAKSLIMSHYITLFGTIKTVVPVMKKVGGGKIIAFSCNSVKYNYPDMAGFTSAKAAVECLIKCIANEQAKYHITANAIALPSVKTESVSRTKPNAFHRDYITLDELTQSIEKLVESFSPYINGNVINLFKYSDSFYHKGYYERNIIGSE